LKISIHNRPGSFSDRWISYCKAKNIVYKIVNCYDSDILIQIKDCDGFMWHWHHADYREQNFARQLIFSLEAMGIKVFPSFKTCWHFDDKVGQKYLLESMNAPLVPSFVFYDSSTALKWIEDTDFPKVFKLRGGAGSQNVQLVNSKNKAISLVKKGFGGGFPLVSSWSIIKQQVWVYRRDKNFKVLMQIIATIVRSLLTNEEFNLLPRQKGYVYFQDFIPENNFDDRIVVIGNRAIAVRRYNRKNDFRASGSGVKSYDPQQFNKDAIRTAFGISEKIGCQSMAYDFIYAGTQIKLVEISYGFAMGEFYDRCPGYWDQNLNWHDDNVDPQRYIIEDFIRNLK
jgi:hypothetical protein